MSLRPFYLLSFVLGGCAASEDAGPSVVAQRLRQCGLLGAGELHTRQLGELGACVAKCLAEASCDLLEARYCQDVSAGALFECEGACFEPVPCGSGMGSFSPRQRCDGTAQCEDGSDEAGCEEVPAAPRYCDTGGERIWTFQRCNGVEDCEDGTDERDCPAPSEQFRCKSPIPQRILQSRVCDLVVDCIDGSDESADQGCAQLSCR